MKLPSNYITPLSPPSFSIAAFCLFLSLFLLLLLLSSSLLLLLPSFSLAFFSASFLSSWRPSLSFCPAAAGCPTFCLVGLVHCPPSVASCRLVLRSGRFCLLAIFCRPSPFATCCCLSLSAALGLSRPPYRSAIAIAITITPSPSPPLGSFYSLVVSNRQPAPLVLAVSCETICSVRLAIGSAISVRHESIL